MSIENANLVQALVQLRWDGATGVQVMGGAGFRNATAGRTAAGNYFIDLEQPLTKDVTAPPAEGVADYLIAPNLEALGDLQINAVLQEGAVVGVFDRIRVNIRVASTGALADPAVTEPFSIAVLRFPSNTLRS